MEVETRVRDGLEPCDGGRYLVGQMLVEVIAFGRYCGRNAVVSRIGGGDRLAIWPREIWMVEYGSGSLVGVDMDLSRSLVRGHGYWLGIGCLVTQVNGELFLSEVGGTNNEYPLECP